MSWRSLLTSSSVGLAAVFVLFGVAVGKITPAIAVFGLLVLIGAGAGRAVAEKRGPSCRPSFVRAGRPSDAPFIAPSL